MARLFQPPALSHRKISHLTQVTDWILFRSCSASTAEAAETKHMTLSGENGVDPQDAKEAAPKPSIKIDNEHDPFATIVHISYGDRLGELLDTVRISVGTGFRSICKSQLQAHVPQPVHISHGDRLDDLLITCALS